MEQVINADYLAKLPLRAHRKKTVCTFDIRLPEKNGLKVERAFNKVRRKGFERVKRNGN